MKYCSHCGGSVRSTVPPGDDRPRFVCDSCKTVYYKNPKLVVGCIPEWDDKILLCRRAIEPRTGLWTIPAGFLEKGETVAQGAIRETLEEAHARVEILSLYTLFDLTHISQVYLIFRARLLDTSFKPGHETAEVKLLGEEEVPWDRIAFPSIRETLWFYFNDRPKGEFPLHMGTIPPPGEYKPRR